MAVTTIGMLVCGLGAGILATIGIAQGSGVPDVPFLQYGALGLAAGMVWFNRLDAARREKLMGEIIDTYRKDVNGMLERSVHAIDELCKRPCMADEKKKKE